MIRHLIFATIFVLAGGFAPAQAQAATTTAWVAAQVDPNEENTTVPFTLATAMELRGARTLADIQRIAGSKGKITERSGDRISYHWISSDKDGGGDIEFIVATVVESGWWGLGMTISGIDGGATINSGGAFLCYNCEPPIVICGEKPPGIADADWHC